MGRGSCELTAPASGRQCRSERAQAVAKVLHPVTLTFSGRPFCNMRRHPSHMRLSRRVADWGLFLVREVTACVDLHEPTRSPGFDFAGWPKGVHRRSTGLAAKSCIHAVEVRRGNAEGGDDVATSLAWRFCCASCRRARPKTAMHVRWQRVDC